MDYQLLWTLFLVIVAPLWIIFHYVTRWRTINSLTGEDEKLLENLWQSAETIESRMANLERILDAERADWKKPV